MTDYPACVRALLAPIGCETFLADYFDQRWVRLEADAGRTRAELLPLAAFERYLVTRRPWESSRPDDGGLSMLSLLREGSYGLPVGSYDELVRACHEQMSFVTQAIHQGVEPIAELAAGLEQMFGAKVTANAYFSPPDSRAFHPHLDPHDVFVVQVHGAKTWQIYEPRVFPAYKRQWLDGGGELELATFDVDTRTSETVVMRAGDCLYLPRGVPHSAAAQDQSSLHVTIALDVMTWADLLGLCVRQLAIESAPARRALAPGFAEPERLAELAATLAELGPELATVDLGAALGRRSRSASVLGPRRGLRSLDELAGLGLDSHVELARGPVELGAHLGQPWLAVGKRKARIPPRTEPYARFVVERAGASFVVDELPDVLPGDSKRVFARWLIREGLASHEPRGGRD